MSAPVRPDRDHLILGVSYWPTGATSSGWRSTSSYLGGIFDPELLSDSARTAERGIFDYFFWGNSEDSNTAQPGGSIRNAFQLNGFTAAAYLAGMTRHIGLVGTVNTTYSDPYTAAQLAVNADHLSCGRFGVNIVAGAPFGAAHTNFGHDEPPSHEDRYVRANEFLEIFTALQDSWSDDWLIADKATGRLFAPEAAREINYRGRVFSVKGPLNAPRPPQGSIPILHAGTSKESFELGARFADVRFSPYTSRVGAQEYAKSQRALAADHGRSASEYAIIVGANIYVADTRQRARELFDEVQRNLVEEFAPHPIARLLGISVESIAPDVRVADVIELAALPEASDARGVLENFAEIVGEGFTFDELHRFIANKKNFPVVVGDPIDVADWIEQGYAVGAFDGVKVFPPFARSVFTDFVDFVVPELQRRGIARSSYTSSTLRGHFGLARPALTRAESALV